jgi:hypothetical protein
MKTGFFVKSLLCIVVFWAASQVRADLYTLQNIVDSYNGNNDLYSTTYYADNTVVYDQTHVTLRRGANGQPYETVNTFCLQYWIGQDGGPFKSSVNLSADGATTSIAGARAGNDNRSAGNLTMGAAILQQLAYGLGRFGEGADKYEYAQELRNTLGSVYGTDKEFYAAVQGEAHRAPGYNGTVANQDGIWQYLQVRDEAFNNGNWYEDYTTNDSYEGYSVTRFLSQLDLEDVFGSTFLMEYAYSAGLEYIAGGMNTLEFWLSDYNPLLDFDNAYLKNGQWYHGASLVLNIYDQSASHDGQDMAIFVETPSSDHTTTPEPASMLIFGFGSVGVGFFCRWRKRNTSAKYPL